MPSIREVISIVKVLAYLGLLAATPLQAGHDIFTQLVVSELKPTGLERPNSPFTIGVPLPATAEIMSTTNLVLVGAEQVQFTVNHRWQSGAIRWLQIDALGDLPANSRSKSLQLTTGQSAPTSRPIAVETSSQATLDNSALELLIPKQGMDLFTFKRNQNSNDPTQSTVTYSLPQNVLNEQRGVVIGINGSTRANVRSVHQLLTPEGQAELTFTISLFRHATTIPLEIAVSAARTNTSSMTLPPIDITFPFRFSSSLPSEKDDLFRFSELEAPQSNEPILLGLRQDASGFVTQLNSSEASTRLTLTLNHSLQPNAVTRTQFVLETQQVPNTRQMLNAPLIGRAASLNTYNDATMFQDQLLPHPAEVQLSDTLLATETDSPFEAGKRLFQSMLQATDESYAMLYLSALRNCETFWQSPNDGAFRPNDALLVWPLVFGDATLISTVATHANSIPELPANPPLPDTLSQIITLVDAYRVALQPSLRSRVWNLIQRDLLSIDWSNPEQRESIARQSRVTLLALRNTLNHCELNTERANQVLDLMEKTLIHTPQAARGERWYAEAYRLTGQSRFLHEGNTLLEEAQGEMEQNLAHLIQAPLRYRLWRPLELQTKELGDGQVQVSWEVPARTERFRIKSSPAPIATGLFPTEPQKPFTTGKELQVPPPLSPGTIQSMTIKLTDPIEGSFVGRFLERGAALPSPAQEEEQTDETNEPVARTGTNIQLLLQIAASAAMLALILMWWKRRTASIVPGILALSLLAAGCTQESDYDIVQVDAKAEEPREADTQEGGFHIQYQPLTDPIPLNEHFSLKVEVTQLKQPNGNLTIEVDADMPAHGHGINTAPSVKQNTDGSYLVEGLLFHMKGDWELYVDVVDGPVRERAAFPIKL